MRCTCLVLVGLITGLTAHAQPGAWSRTNGPAGGNIAAIAMSDEGALYASTLDRLFVSDDRASTWAELTLPPDNPYHFSVVAGPGRSVCLVRTDGLFCSADDGAHWAHVLKTADLRLEQVLVRADTLYAGTSAGVYMSADGGATWTPPAGNVPNGYMIYRLAVLPGGRFVAFAVGSRGEALFASSDRGATWANVGAGLPDHPIVLGLAATAGDTLLAQLIPPALYRSADGGVSWERAIWDELDRINALAAHPNGVAIVQAGQATYVSQNAGRFWTNWGDSVPHAVAFAIDGSGHVFAATRGGVFRTGTQQPDWQFTSAGLHAATVLQLTMLPGGTLVAIGTGGIFRSTDQGETWTRTHETEAVALHRRDDGALFAATTDHVVVRSDDGGVTWTETSRYVLWGSLNYGPVPVHAVASVPGGALLASTGPEGGIMRSLDDGKTWSRLATGLPTLFPGAYPRVNAFAVARDQAVLACMGAGAAPGEGGVYRLGPDDVWSPMNTGLPGYNDPSSQPSCGTVYVSQDGTIFAAVMGSDGNQLARLDEASRTWTVVGAGIFDAATIGGVAFGASGRLFAATRDAFDSLADGVVYASDDLGDTWREVYKDPLLRNINALMYDDGGTLWAGTTGEGVVRTRVPFGVDRVRPEHAVPGRTSLAQNHPNPFGRETTIAFELRVPGPVRLTVYDVLGREVARLVDAVLPAGRHGVRWQPGGTVPGTYYYVLEAEMHRTARRMALVR